jgi:hypothetical protein
MHIANPIYDVVFKYMMEDEKVARAFLSAIIGEEVVELDFAPREYILKRASRLKEKETTEEDVKDSESSCFTVSRFDFSAKIATAGGFKTVLIELQKAKLLSDIMRFRRYLGLHYCNPKNTYMEDNVSKARQIYCIFLLAYGIGLQGRPVIQVNNTIKDATTNEEIKISNEFIDGLHHRSWIVQISELKQRRRNDLEILLSIFDHENRDKGLHILNVNDADFPDIFRPIIRRLQMACESEDIQVGMEMEDDILQELQDKEREIDELGKTVKNQRKVLKEKDKALKEQAKAIKGKDKAIEEKDKVIEEKDKALKEKDKAIEELAKAFEDLKKQVDDFIKQ